MDDTTTYVMRINVVVVGGGVEAAATGVVVIDNDDVQELLFSRFRVFLLTSRLVRDSTTCDVFSTASGGLQSEFGKTRKFREDRGEGRDPYHLAFRAASAIQKTHEVAVTNGFFRCPLPIPTTPGGENSKNRCFRV